MKKNNNNKIIHKNSNLNNVKTSTRQNFCSQIYYDIVFYYNSQNTQIQVLENRKQKIVTKHILCHWLTRASLTSLKPYFWTCLSGCQVSFERAFAWPHLSFACTPFNISLMLAWAGLEKCQSALYKYWYTLLISRYCIFPRGLARVGLCSLKWATKFFIFLI